MFYFLYFIANQILGEFYVFPLRTHSYLVPFLFQRGVPVYGAPQDGGGGGVALYFSYSLFALLCLVSVYWCGKKFGSPTMDSIVFTLSLLRHKGIDTSYFIFSYLKNAAYALAAALLFTYAYRFARRKAFARTALIALPVAITVLSAVVFDKRSFALQYIVSGFKASSFIEEHYTVPDLSALSYPEKKRNLVLVVMESAENALNISFSKPLMPLLLSYQKDNITFKNYTPLYKTGSTIGSLVAFYFGLNFTLPYKNLNSFDSKITTSFMPNALSIFEVFTQGGYDIYFATGASKEFSGKGNALETHAKGIKIFDRTYLLEEFNLPVSARWWGQKDKDVYEFSKTKLLEIAQKPNPFVYIIETTDTHAPKGMVYGDFPEEYGDYRDSFVAADYLAYDFTEWLKTQDFYGDTVIILIGDHPLPEHHVPVAAAAKTFTKDTTIQRAIYNVFLNTHGMCYDAADKPYSAIDIAPTILESVGITLPLRRFGLGVSLCASVPTLVEEYGAETLNSEFGQRSHFYQKFW